MIQGSNDGENWETIDTRNNDSNLNGSRLVHSFEINNSKNKFRFIRMILTSNWKNTHNFAIESFEIYGSLYDL